MHPLMTGQESDRSSGVQGLLTRGQEGRRGAVPVSASPTATDLLAGIASTGSAVDHRRDAPGAAAGPRVGRLPIAVPSADVEVVLDPRWLADLDDPTLVISAGYVGPDRRRTPRTWNEPEPAGSRWSALLRRVGQILFMTVLVVVPLAVIATHSVPPTTQAPAAGTPASGPTTGHGHQATHTYRATPQQMARAEAAYRRAVARTTSAPVQAATVTGTGSDSAHSTVAAARSVAAEQAAVVVAQVRAAAKVQAAQARAATQAAAEQRHAAAAAAARGDAVLP